MRNIFVIIVIFRPSTTEAGPQNSKVNKLEWRNIDFEVPVKRNPIQVLRRESVQYKKILENVSGVIDGGMLTAIMGPSGVSTILSHRSNTHGFTIIYICHSILCVNNVVGEDLLIECPCWYCPIHSRCHSPRRLDCGWKDQT